jgi:hypothetical protein
MGIGGIFPVIFRDLVFRDSLIYAYTDTWRSAAPFLFGAMFILGLAIIPNVYSGSKVKGYLIKVALIAVVAAGVIASTSPRGYPALVAWTLPSQPRTMEAEVESIVRQWRKERDCESEANLKVDTFTNRRWVFSNMSDFRICLDEKVVGTMPEKGDRVSLQGRWSFLGLWVDKVSKVNSENPARR